MDPPEAEETNLQVWRQLWRVLERCHVAVCVIDARHPLLHLPPALIYHVNRRLAETKREKRGEVRG